MARKFLPFALLPFLLAACSPPVSTTPNPDGSTTTNIRTEDGTNASVTSKDGEASFKDDKGNQLNVTEKDGTTRVTGKNADGTTFSMESGATADLSPFGVKEYPNQLPQDDSDSRQTVTTPQGQAVTVSFRTNDTPQQVVRFYEPQITQNKSVTTGETTSMVGGRTAAGATAVIIVEKADKATRVTVSLSLEKKP